MKWFKRYCIRLKGSPVVLLLLLAVLFFAYQSKSLSESPVAENPVTSSAGTSLVVLGTIQDGGSPHIGCTRDCCKGLFDSPDKDRQVVSLGLYDAETGKKYLFEATPDIARQSKALKSFGAERMLKKSQSFLCLECRSFWRKMVLGVNC